MPTYDFTPNGDKTKGWSVTTDSGGDHHTEIADSDDATFVRETGSANKNDRYYTNGDTTLPPLLKTVEKISFHSRLSGKAGSLDVQQVLHDGDGGSLGFRNCDFDTGGVSNIEDRVWDKTVSLTRSQLSNPQIRVKTLATGAGDPKDS